MQSIGLAIYSLNVKLLPFPVDGEEDILWVAIALPAVQHKGHLSSVFGMDCYQSVRNIWNVFQKDTTDGDLGQPPCRTCSEYVGEPSKFSLCSFICTIYSLVQMSPGFFWCLTTKVHSCPNCALNCRQHLLF